MGIPSLGSYMQRNKVLQKYRLRDTRLIIDGKNLCHVLMNNSCSGSKFGGNYDVFSSYVEQFLRILKNCRVEPYVIMDGAYDPDNKKFNYLIDKCEKNIYIMAKGHLKCFPILSHRCFTYTVKKLGIPIETCNYEADREIAMLAKSWKCPVLSNDNDFFIYNLPGGYIRYTDLRFNNNACEVDKITSIDTRIYYVEKIQSALGIAPSLLPLLVVFLDNDYFTLDPAIIKLFVSRVHKIPIEEADRKLRKPIDAMIEALRTIGNVPEGIDLLYECLGDFNDKSKTIENANVILKQFDTSSTGEASTIFDAEFNDSACGGQILLPSWLIKNIRSCDVSPFVVNVLDKRVLLKPNLEDLNQEYMYNITSSLRQIMYKMVTGKKLQDVIVEHHRTNCQMDETRVFPITSSLKIGKIPDLNNMASMKEEERLSFLSKIFQVPSEKLAKVPNDSKMFVLALNYLARNSGLKESMKGIKCLLFSHMLLLWKEYGRIYEFPVDPFCANRVFDYCSDSYKVPFDIQLLHEFQRFQVVMDILYDLNGLLMAPVMKPPTTVMYKGGLMYPLFTKTENEQHLDRIIDTCFKKETALRGKFLELLTFIRDSL